MRENYKYIVINGVLYYYISHIYLAASGGPCDLCGFTTSSTGTLRLFVHYICDEPCSVRCTCIYTSVCAYVCARGEGLKPVCVCVFSAGGRKTSVGVDENKFLANRINRG